MIYKVCGVEAWRRAQDIGCYEGSAVDVQDGFIHFSAKDQLRGTAAKHFAGRSDLVLFAVDDAALGEALKWEPSRGGALFPHLYSALDISLVAWIKPLPIDEFGKHIFPEL